MEGPQRFFRKTIVQENLLCAVHAADMWHEQCGALEKEIV